MPALPPRELLLAISNAIEESGYAGRLASPIRHHPRLFAVAGPDYRGPLYVYVWTLTFGGRPSLANEYRIQMTSVDSLEIANDGPTILIGYEPTHNLFAGFDIEQHRTFTPGSSSVQIDVTVLRTAEQEGLSFHRKNNDEIAIGIRPDMFMVYALNAGRLHRFGGEGQIFNLLNRAVRAPVPERDIRTLSAERRRVVTEVSRLSRDAAFRRQVLFAYGDRCAVTRLQLRLVEAAHILPVEATGSVDHVQNGIALSPTYHKAFDAGLIYLSEDYAMRLDEGKIALLRGLDLVGGVRDFRRHMGQIFLPPDPRQHPSVEFIRQANRFRQITTR
jgi:putative restriction endonuclease